MSENSILLENNVESIFPSKEALATKLRSGERLKIYLGIDPTSPEIHIGNAIALWKLKEFQKLGHKVILLIGDFTGAIGDPSGKDTIRKDLSREKILENSREYRRQASKILEFEGKNKAMLEFNSKWLSKLFLGDILELSENFTVQQLIERDMFQERLKEKKPIGLHEFLYPLLQGYDSVAMNVDIEIGGTDQTFNMLLGRGLMKTIKNKDKFVITLPLLEGTDGRKMSKSYGNTIGISEIPNEMYGKIMSLKDELILKYFDLCTNLPKEELNKIETRLQTKNVNPVESKNKLAFEIVTRYYGTKAATQARTEFIRVFKKGERTSNVKEIELPRPSEPISYASLAYNSGGTASVSEAVRLAENKGLKVDGNIITNPREEFTEIVGDETIVDIGKRKSVKIVWK